MGLANWIGSMVGYDKVKQGMTITQAQAETFLKQDLEKFEKLVEKYNGKYGWNMNFTRWYLLPLTLAASIS